MPIFDQGYQHWQGHLSGHGLRWLAVTRQGVRQQFRRRRTKGLVFIAFVPALGLAAVLIFWGLLEQGSDLIKPFNFVTSNLPEQVTAGPKAYRAAVWTLAFNFFFYVESFFAMLLVLTVGPDLVSQDLRFNAMPLYFSRPIRRIDYFLGKLGVIGFFLSAVSVAPAVLAYAVGVAFSLDLGVIRDTWRLLVASIGIGAIVVLSAGTLMLAISSLSRSSRLVGAAWVSLWVISNSTAAVLEETTHRDWCPTISYTTNLERIREELLDVATARWQFQELIQASRDSAPQVMRPLLPFGPRFRPPPPRPRQSLPRPRYSRDDNFEEGMPPLIRTPEYLLFPWTWSVAILTGLFVASALTLSTRVKSMDRLR
jgi:ABC-2 type transport system permease protein